jgi:WD40 repeat protein
MPTRLSRLTTSLFLLTACCTAADLKPIASVPLPCESPSQMISPAGDQLAIDCPDHSAMLLSISSGTIFAKFDPKPGITGLAYSRDGRFLALGRSDGAVEILSTSASAPPRHFKVGPRVGTLDFSPDSTKLIVGAIDGPGEVWDLGDTPKRIAALQQDFGGLIDCAFSPDGKLLVTADGDTLIRFYDTATWQLQHVYRGILLETFIVTFAADGKHVLLGGPDSHITQLDTSAADPRLLERDAGVVVQIFPFGTSAQALVNYFDGEGRAPSHQSIWSVDTGKTSPLPSDAKITGIGVVRNHLWLASLKDRTLQISEYR